MYYEDEPSMPKKRRKTGLQKINSKCKKIRYDELKKKERCKMKLKYI